MNKTHILDDQFVFEYDDVDVGDTVLDVRSSLFPPRTGFVTEKSMSNNDRPNVILNGHIKGWIHIVLMNQDGQFDKDEYAECWISENEAAEQIDPRLIE